MPLKYKLDFIVDNTGETASVSGELTNEELKLLTAFSTCAEDVWNTKFMQEPHKGEFQIDWHRDTGTNITTVLPEWDNVTVFLHKFRPLLLQREETNFYKVHNLLAKKSGPSLFSKFNWLTA
jgi:hypothetical protein